MSPCLIQSIEPPPLAMSPCLIQSIELPLPATSTCLIQSIEPQLPTKSTSLIGSREPLPPAMSTCLNGSREQPLLAKSTGSNRSSEMTSPQVLIAPSITEATVLWEGSKARKRYDQNKGILELCKQMNDPNLIIASTKVVDGQWEDLVNTVEQLIGQYEAGLREMDPVLESLRASHAQLATKMGKIYKERQRVVVCQSGLKLEKMVKMAIILARDPKREGPYFKERSDGVRKVCERMVELMDVCKVVEKSVELKAMVLAKYKYFGGSADRFEIFLKIVSELKACMMSEADPVFMTWKPILYEVVEECINAVFLADAALKTEALLFVRQMLYPVAAAA